MCEFRFEFLEVDQDNWDDLALLFDGRGGPKYCWCMVWRATPAEARCPAGKSRRTALRSRVASGMPVGILGYHQGVPMAWCSIASRSTYRRLGGADDFAEDPDAVWSLVCFFVKCEYRGHGVTDQLLQAAIAHAGRRGAKIVEAYPVDPDSPSYRFMGFVRVFERAGFKKVGAAGTRRHVMRLELA
jgi:GNAT superfamily N-acetyltransferase